MLFCREVWDLSEDPALPGIFLTIGFKRKEFSYGKISEQTIISKGAGRRPAG